MEESVISSRTSNHRRARLVELFGNYMEFHPRNRRERNLLQDVWPRDQALRKWTERSQGPARRGISRIKLPVSILMKTHCIGLYNCPPSSSRAKDDLLDVRPSTTETFETSDSQAALFITRRSGDDPLRRGQSNISLQGFHFAPGVAFREQGDYRLGLERDANHRLPVEHIQAR